jgi:hypothetical protein
MEAYGIPFVYRALVLLVVLFVLGTLDFLRHGRKATRWREYLFLVAWATIGAVVGISTDAVTSRLSPEYFTVGKGVQGGEGFDSRALLLGAHAGFLAGAVAAICCLVANNPRSGLPVLPYRTLSRLALISLALTVCGGLVVGIPLAFGVASALVPWVELPVTTDRAAAFITAWGIHTGLYAGLLVGIVIAVVRTRRWRRERVVVT